MNLSSIKTNLLNISFWRNGFTPKSSISCMNAGVRSHNSTVRQVAGDRKPVFAERSIFNDIFREVKSSLFHKFEIQKGTPEIGGNDIYRDI